jgi:hypothetical protein
MVAVVWGGGTPQTEAVAEEEAMGGSAVTGSPPELEPHLDPVGWRSAT